MSHLLAQLQKLQLQNKYHTELFGIGSYILSSMKIWVLCIRHRYHQKLDYWKKDNRVAHFKYLTIEFVNYTSIKKRNRKKQFLSKGNVNLWKKSPVQLHIIPLKMWKAKNCINRFIEIIQWNIKKRKTFNPGIWRCENRLSSWLINLFSICCMDIL